MADFLKTNEIQTRISLKYDSYENWSTKNPILLKGEVAIATIPAGTTTTPAMQNLPNVVMKVGDGASHYNDLKFVSGLAADVYDWAKAPNKPSYGIGEIVGALEYCLVVTNAANYKYELQSREIGSDKWNKVSDLDLSGLASRLTTAEGKIKAVEDDLTTPTTGLKDRMTAAENAIKNINNTGIGGAITAAIEGLDATEEQAAGADGLTLKVVQTDGVITEISGSIAANTYDAHGAADDVKTALLNGEIKANADAIKKINGNDTGKSMREVVNSAIGVLDATKDQVAGADGLALHIKEEDGVITEFSGSIAANTYDAYGAAEAVRGGDANYKETVKSAYDRADAAYALADEAQTAKEVSDAIDAKIQALDFGGVEGTQAGATIKFVDKVSQADGVVSAELGELVFNSVYDATNNKAATMADINNKLAELNNALIFKGVYDEVPSKDKEGNDFEVGAVVIVGVKEYVFSPTENGNAFIELGEEGAIAAAIQALDSTKSQEAAEANGKLALSITQTDGVITSISGSITANTYDAYGAAAGVKEALENGIIKTHTEKLATIQGSEADANKSMRTVAAEEASNAVKTLNVTDIAVGVDSTLTVIGQTDGSIHATVEKIKIAQGQVDGLSDALKNKLDASVYNDFKTKDFDPVKDAVENLTSGDGSVANSISTAISNLKNTDAAVDGQYVKAVKQSNGIVTVERAALPALAIDHDDSVEEPTATEVTVVKDIDHNGFTITDTHVKVATSAGIAAAIAALDADKNASSTKHVMTGITQTDGVIESIDEVELADIAFSGDVKDLKQTANTYVVFNCGSASVNV